MLYKTFQAKQAKFVLTNYYDKTNSFTSHYKHYQKEKADKIGNVEKSLKPSFTYDYNRSIKQFILWLRKHVKLCTMEARYLQLLPNTCIFFHDDFV